MSDPDTAAWQLVDYIRQLRDDGALDHLEDHQRARIDELLTDTEVDTR